MHSVDDYIAKARALKTSSVDAPAVSIYEKNTYEFVKLNWPQHIDYFTSIIYDNSMFEETQYEFQQRMEKVADFLEQMKDEPSSKGSEALAPPDINSFHSEIVTGCGKLFSESNYPEAVEKGFKIVRDKLRKLSGNETITKALSSNKIHFNGAADLAVDKDFQEAAKYLLMSIDFFRNEKAHVPNGNIDNPIRAVEYLGMASLAMRLLDNVTVTPRT